jgi:hypothetical protein
VQRARCAGHAATWQAREQKKAARQRAQRCAAPAAPHASHGPGIRRESWSQ